MSAIAWPLLVMALGVTGIGVTLWRNQARPRRLPNPASALELEELEEILEVSAGTLRIDVTYHAPLPGQSTSKVTVAATSLPPAFKRQGETELLPEYRNTWTVWSGPEGGAVSLAESVYEEIAEIVVAWSGPAERAQQSLAKRREVQALELDVDLGGGD